MSSYVGIIFIDSCSSVITIGDGNKLAPTSTDATFAGAGNFDIGELQVITNLLNKTQVIDNDVIDQSFVLDL